MLPSPSSCRSAFFPSYALLSLSKPTTNMRSMGDLLSFELRLSTCRAVGSCPDDRAGRAGLAHLRGDYMSKTTSVSAGCQPRQTPDNMSLSPDQSLIGN